MRQRNQRGFTIVELLIVIVVIAILATITIVAYNGIQSRARSSSGSSQSAIVLKKAEVYNTLYGVYPTYCQIATNTTNPTGTTPTSGTGAGTCVAGATAVGREAILANVNVITPIAVTSATGANGSVVSFKRCTTNGVKVGYWDYGAGTPAVVYRTAGDVSTC